MTEYTADVSDRLQKLMKKLFKKDRRRYEALISKIEEIVESGNPHHYKNLRGRRKIYKRVHIDSSFVLLFVVDEERKLIHFINLKHHDSVY